MAFFQTLPAYEKDLFTNKKAKTNEEVARTMLAAAIQALEALPQWDQASVHDCLIALAERLGTKNATLMWPVRIAAAGQAGDPRRSGGDLRHPGPGGVPAPPAAGAGEALMREHLSQLGRFLKEDLRHTAMGCAIGMVAAIALGAVAGALAPEVVTQVMETFMEMVLEAGVVDEAGNLSPFALLLNNWRAMLVTICTAFSPSSTCRC